MGTPYFSRPARRIRWGVKSLPPILVLDDSADNTFILTRLLARAGVQNKVVCFEEARPACAYVGAEAQKAGSLFFPILIFTDLDMPGGDGCAFATCVRHEVGAKTVPIFMITGSNDPVAHARARAAGVNQVLEKFPSTSTLRELAKGCGCEVS